MKAKLEQRQALAGARSTAHWHGFQIRAPCSSARSVAGRAVAAPDAPSTSQRLPLPPPDRNQRIREGGSEAALVQAQVRPLGRNHGAGIRRGGAPCAARRCADGRCPLLSRTPLAPRPHAPAPPPRSPVLQARRRPGLARVAAGGAAARRERRRGRRRLRPGGSLPRSAAGAARPQRRPRGCVADFKRSCRRSACMQQCSRACGRVQHAALQHAAGRPAHRLRPARQHAPLHHTAHALLPSRLTAAPTRRPRHALCEQLRRVGRRVQIAGPRGHAGAVVPRRHLLVWRGQRGAPARMAHARAVHACVCMHALAWACMRSHARACACRGLHARTCSACMLSCACMRSHAPAWARMGPHGLAFNRMRDLHWQAAVLTALSLLAPTLPPPAEARRPRLWPRVAPQAAPAPRGHVRRRRRALHGG